MVYPSPGIGNSKWLGQWSMAEMPQCVSGLWEPNSLALRKSNKAVKKPCEAELGPSCIVSCSGPTSTSLVSNCCY